MPPSFRRLVVAVAGGLVCSVLWPILVDAIVVAPTAVFIDHRARTGEVYLVNRGTAPEEVSVELKFGFPESDSSGDVHIRLFDQPPAEFPSAAGWMRAFPRRVVVPPGGQQLVRLMATPPADLPDGEYWSRILITSRQAAQPIQLADSGVRAQINVELRTIISLMYRKGEVHTGLTLGPVRASLEGDSLVVWMDLARTGNAAYLGTARVSLHDPQGAFADQQWDTQVAVYVPLRRRLAFPVGALRPGAYAVTLTLSTAREDIPQGNVLPVEPTERTRQLEVPVR